jgi:hypothetical protein
MILICVTKSTPSKNYSTALQVSPVTPVTFQRGGRKFPSAITWVPAIFARLFSCRFTIIINLLIVALAGSSKLLIQVTSKVSHNCQYQ